MNKELNSAKVVLPTGQELTGYLDLLLDREIDELTGEFIAKATLVGINLEDLPRDICYKEEITVKLEIMGLTYLLKGVYLGDGRINFN